MRWQECGQLKHFSSYCHKPYLSLISMSVTSLQCTFVPRIKGKRVVTKASPHEFVAWAQREKMTPNFTAQEHFTGKNLVRPYYDWDAKMKHVPTPEEAKEAADGHLAAFKEVLSSLHPGDDVVYAQRHGKLSGAGEYKYKVSFRAFVQGVKVVASLIPHHARGALKMRPNETHEYLDLSVYKEKEQLLGVIYGCKDTDQIKRYLTPLDESIPLENYLVQNVSDEDVELIVNPVKRTSDCKMVDSSASNDSTEGATTLLAGDKYKDVLKAASECFRQYFHLREKFSQIKVEADKQRLIFNCKEKWCFIRDEVHTGNHQYIIVNQKNATYKCHDEECKEKARERANLSVPFNALPDALRTLFTETVFEVQVSTDDMIEASEDCKRNITASHPEEKKSPLKPCQVLTKFVTAASGQTCRHCQGRNMDFVHSITGWQQHCRDCEGTYPEDMIPIATDKYPALIKTLTQLNITINNTLNITNINISGNGDVYLDQYFNEIHPIFEDDPVLNKLIFQSLKNNTWDIALVMHHVGQDIMGVSEGGDEWWFWNEAKRRWSHSSCWVECYLSEVVADYYVQVQKWFRENTTDAQLAKIRELRLDTLIKRLKDKDKAAILKDARTVFSVKQDVFENRLDANKDLLGFDGYVYELHTGIYRPARPADYVSKSCGYALPEPDVQQQAEIMQFIRDIQEENEDVEYLLMWLASTLDGHNRDEIFTCLQGSGRNGKSALASDLMAYVLGGNPDDTQHASGYYHTISATMLTSMRPSSSSPVPDILHLKGKRFVVASEPEKNTSINGGFLKFLSGNDMISGRWCHRNEDVRFLPQHSIAILTNDVPAISSEDDAIWARARFIKFPFKFVTNVTNPNEKVIDMTLKRKMKTWGPQFMLILLEYYKKYRNIGHLEPTEKVLRTNASIRDDNDPYVRFIDEKLVKTENESDRLLQADLNRAFRHWHSQAGYPKGHKVNTQELKAKMASKGFVLKNSIRPGVDYMSKVSYALTTTSGAGYEYILLSRDN